eukprot:COSAG01_NODE_6266_length_3763_cov_285.644924_2_plen_478_part_00
MGKIKLSQLREQQLSSSTLATEKSSADLKQELAAEQEASQPRSRQARKRMLALLALLSFGCTFVGHVYRGSGGRGSGSGGSIFTDQSMDLPTISLQVDNVSMGVAGPSMSVSQSAAAAKPRTGVLPSARTAHDPRAAAAAAAADQSMATQPPTRERTAPPYQTADGVFPPRSKPGLIVRKGVTGPHAAVSTTVASNASAASTAASHKAVPPRVLVSPQQSFAAAGLGRQSSAAAEVELLIGVLSARGNFVRRTNIRRAWQKQVEATMAGGGVPTRVVFIVGSRGGKESGGADGDSNHEQLQRECVVHHDIVLVDALDVYKNSATKMLAFYSSLTVANVQFTSFMKVDDDSYVVGELLLPHYLGRVREQMRLKDRVVWWGSYRMDDEPMRSAAGCEAGSVKCYVVTRAEYPPARYPLYAIGPGHVMNRRMARRIGGDRAAWGGAPAGSRGGGVCRACWPHPSGWRTWRMGVRQLAGFV